MAPLLLAAGALAAAQKLSLALALGVIIGASLLADLLWIALAVLALERLGASAREPGPATAVSLAGLPSEVP